MEITTRKGWLALLLTSGLVYGLGACNPKVTIQERPVVDCDLGESQCGDVCVDFLGDSLNCGVCGNVCADGEACYGGACQFGNKTQCDGGTIDCGSYCTDVHFDASNCGACGLQCGFGETCNNGSCTVNQADCPFYEDIRCNGVCTDVMFDPNNCGGCGISCGPGGSCGEGLCTTSGCQDPGVCGACDMFSLPSQVPIGFQTEAPTTNALEPDCAAPGSPETALLYAAPVTGTYVFDTFGAPHDTSLYIIDANGCGQIACNDDAPEVLQSEVTVSLSQGQQVVIVVDGYGGDTGETHLNVQLQ